MFGQLENQCCEFEFRVEHFENPTFIHTPIGSKNEFRRPDSKHIQAHIIVSYDASYMHKFGTNLCRMIRFIILINTGLVTMVFERMTKETMEFRALNLWRIYRYN